MSEALRSTVVAARCLLRRLPLFFRASPKTPLRVLGIVAFDTLHVMRRSKPLPPHRVAELAAFLDFEGCANAEWDHKRRCEAECLAIRRRLGDAGLDDCVEAYLNRLEQIEVARPTPGGDRRRFADIREYREAVARLSLSTAAAIALQPDRRPEHIRMALDEDVEILARILMQCQIVDDVLDYDEDVAAGLPSFLTAAAALPDGLRWTAEAARSYWAVPRSERPSRVFPFCAAHWIFGLVATVVIHISRGGHLSVRTHAPQRP